MLWLMMLAASLAASVPAPRTPAIGVFIDFDAVPSPRLLEVMKTEAGKIMSSAGYQLDWRALKDARGKESFSRVVVVKFHGQCRLEYPAVEGPGEEAVRLASTLMRDGHVLPYSEVECDQVRKVMAYGTPPDRQNALGIALGRVVAHELYHLLADTARHAGAGIAKATQDWLDLAAGASAFRAADLPRAGAGQ